jgi:hypothetical protein
MTSTPFKCYHKQVKIGTKGGYNVYKHVVMTATVKTVLVVPNER